MLDDPQVTLDRFATKLGSLRQAYERNPKSFDVAGGFLTGPPMFEEQVRQVEGEYGLALPPEYRAFLRRFGDTRTGPGNSFSCLKEGLTPNSGKPFPLDRPFLGCESPSHQRLPKDEQWEEYGRLLKEWEKIPLDHGVVNICGYGCAIYGVLIINGPFCGKVWIVSGDAAYYGPFGGAEALHDEEAGADGWEPTETPKDYSFFEWYESWLDGQLKRIPAR
jgi:SMI1 / KNR4 family (SUKH-1)